MHVRANTLALLAVAVACTGPTDPTDAPHPVDASDAPPAPTGPEDTPVALADAVPATVAAASAWGAVFTGPDGASSRLGPAPADGGLVVVGSAGAGSATLTGAQGACGGQGIDTGGVAAVVTLPPGAAVPVLPDRQPVQAALVERASWRIDEVLPARDLFSPAISQAAPAQQRGIRQGSLIKIQRAGAPPVFAATGTRDCHGALVIVDAQVGHTLSHDAVPDACDTLALLPAADLDGDGAVDLVAHGSGLVVAWTLRPRGSGVQLERLGHWTCPAAADATDQGSGGDAP